MVLCVHSYHVIRDFDYAVIPSLLLSHRFLLHSIVTAGINTYTLSLYFFSLYVITAPSPYVLWHPNNQSDVYSYHFPQFCFWFLIFDFLFFIPIISMLPTGHLFSFIFLFDFSVPFETLSSLGFYSATLSWFPPTNGPLFPFLPVFFDDFSL